MKENTPSPGGTSGTPDPNLRRAADELRETLVRTVLQAYEDAGMSGLCEEGRLEVAVDALRQVDFEALLRQYAGEPGGSSHVSSDQ